MPARAAASSFREWLTPKDDRTPAVIISVAHLDDDERTLVLGVLLEEILAYTRSLPGIRHLTTRPESIIFSLVFLPIWPTAIVMRS
jgi:hypothetical protein